MLKVATDCTGIGSPEQALKELQIPHEIIFACERDKYAQQTYLANFTPNQMFEDMTTRDNYQDGIYSDLYIAGIPCQSFSLAGKRLGELDPRGLLFYNFYDYVKKQQPKYFIIENVKGLLSTGNVFQTWLELLGQSVNTHYNMFNHEDSLMYNLHWTVLNSKDFGVPQNRERVFIVGIRNDLPNNFSFPTGKPLAIRLKDILEPVVDEKYYLSDKALEYLLRAKQERTENVKYDDGTGFASTITANYRKWVHNGGETYITEPICVAMRGRNPENPSDRTVGAPTEQRLEPNSQGTTNTITSVQKDNLILENKTRNRIRRLTPLECFRLQGFPDSYIKPCSDSQTYKQAGNSITVNTIKAILSNLISK